jgi:hypothetical protein
VSEPPTTPLLLYLASSEDPQRVAVGPALAAAAERAGWGFECYYDALRRGRHFGGGDPDTAHAAGAPLAGGQHAERASRLCELYSVAALGDPASPLWPPLERGAAEELARSTSPAELYEAALARLGAPAPELALVLDALPQGSHGIVTAPFLYPALLDGPPALALEVSAGASEHEALERLGVRRFAGIGVAPERAATFPGGLDSHDTRDVSTGWATFTAEAAARHPDWGRGALLGDPALVAAQLPKARRLRLLPLHGRPQTEVIEAAGGVIRTATEPVFGRQWDDHDFFAIARAGHGLQVVDPGPPFDAAGVSAPALPEPSLETKPEPEPSDAELERWASEGRVLVTLLVWCGMLRELDCLPRLADLAALTDLRAGLVVTAETFEHGAGEALGLLAVPPRRGGLLGRLEPVLGSTGRGVAAEAYLGGDRLAEYLTESLEAIEARAPAELRPRGWWPLLDAPLVRHRELPLGRRGVRPVARFRPRGAATGAAVGEEGVTERRDLRALAGRTVRATGLDALLEERRPYDGWRPGALDDGVVAAVRDVGLEYMWSKTRFGEPTVLRRDGHFVVLPFTAGAWDGWSPFYTVGDVGALFRAERRLLARGAPGWVASTIDSPLFALPGEIWENGGRLHAIASAVARGGRTGELVNVTPRVVARYARLLGGPAPAAPVP